MVHAKYIKINGKNYGPYYYESYREGDKVKKRYIKELREKLKSKKDNLVPLTYWIQKKKEGQLRVLLPILFFLMTALVIVAAQNLNDSNSSEVIGKIDLCADVICKGSEIECPDGFIASCLNTCDSERGECSTCIPDCAGHAPSENNAQPSLNDTDSEEPVLNESDENISEPIPRQSPEPVPEHFSEPLIDLNTEIPEKVTRGEVIELKAIAVNNGNRDVNIFLSWQLPHGFEIIQGDLVENCDIASEDSCISEISVQTSFSTFLGEGEIKVLGGYNE